jgi:hypothetical protein
MSQKFIKTMTGYKATDANLKCRDHQFVIGEWTPEITGDLELCAKGWHFCISPSGVWSYYPAPGTRVFKCEAEDILEVPTEAGADFKLVARRVRLTEEVTPGMNGNDKSNTGYSNTGNSNTGYRNTGNSNTGNRNTGYRNTGNSNTGNSNTGNSNTGNSNTGDRNTGNSNTGYRNTGNSNTGDSNTGYRNTGNSNTGYRNTGNSNTGNSNTGNRNTGNSNTGDSNTGYSNTGYSNTGYRNTGNSNTGYRNTGDSNATNYSAGWFCQVEPKVVSFDKQTKLTRKQFEDKYPEVFRLSELLINPAPIPFDEFKRIPGITPAKLKSLHRKHLAARAK